MNNEQRIEQLVRDFMRDHPEFGPPNKDDKVAQEILYRQFVQYYLEMLRIKEMLWQNGSLNSLLMTFTQNDGKQNSDLVAESMQLASRFIRDNPGGYLVFLLSHLQPAMPIAKPTRPGTVKPSPARERIQAAREQGEVALRQELAKTWTIGIAKYHALDPFIKYYEQHKLTQHKNKHKQHAYPPEECLQTALAKLSKSMREIYYAFDAESLSAQITSIACKECFNYWRHENPRRAEQLQQEKKARQGGGDAQTSQPRTDIKILILSVYQKTKEGTDSGLEDEQANFDEVENQDSEAILIKARLTQLLDMYQQHKKKGPEDKTIQAMRLKWIDERSETEIAAIQGDTEGGVHQRISRGLDKLFQVPEIRQELLPIAERWLRNHTWNQEHFTLVTGYMHDHRSIEIYVSELLSDQRKAPHYKSLAKNCENIIRQELHELLKAYLSLY